MAKSIQVKDETWQMLTRMKADLMYGDLDEVILTLIKISKQIKTADLYVSKSKKEVKNV